MPVTNSEVQSLATYLAEAMINESIKGLPQKPCRFKGTAAYKNQVKALAFQHEYIAQLACEYFHERYDIT